MDHTGECTPGKVEGFGERELHLSVALEGGREGGIGFGKITRIRVRVILEEVRDSIFISVVSWLVVCGEAMAAEPGLKAIRWIERSVSDGWLDEEIDF